MGQRQHTALIVYTTLSLLFHLCHFICTCHTVIDSHANPLFVLTSAQFANAVQVKVSGRNTLVNFGSTLHASIYILCILRAPDHDPRTVTVTPLSNIQMTNS